MRCVSVTAVRRCVFLLSFTHFAYRILVMRILVVRSLSTCNARSAAIVALAQCRSKGLMFLETEMRVNTISLTS